MERPVRDGRGARGATSSTRSRSTGTTVYIGGNFGAFTADSGIPLQQRGDVERPRLVRVSLGAPTARRRRCSSLAARLYVGGQPSPTPAPSPPTTSRSGAGPRGRRSAAVISNPISGDTPAVNALAMLGTKLFVGGTFEKAGRVVANSIAIVERDGLGGRRERGHSTASGTAAPAKPHPRARSTRYSPSARSCTSAGPSTRRPTAEIFSLARWSGTRGPNVSGLGVESDSGNGTVNALAENPTGPVIYVGGSLRSRRRHVERRQRHRLGGGHRASPR